MYVCSSIKIIYIHCYFIFHRLYVVYRKLTQCKNVQNARDSVLEIAGDNILWKMLPRKDRCAIITTKINFYEDNVFLSILPLLKKKENT